MHQEIFTLGLPVETVSLYLMCSAVSSEGQSIERRQLSATWNGTAAALDKALAELVQRGILEQASTGAAGQQPRYRLTPLSRWRPSA
jgi:hypothetical protein